jgi:hypothetical protein
MSKKRHTIPKPVEKRAYQETGSACAFCREREIASLEVHHIDGDPANNKLENLLVVCGTCHGKITGGVISLADVAFQKRMAHFGELKPVDRGNEASVRVNIVGSNFRGDVAHTITKITASRPLKMQYPIRSIGANLEMKGYIDYLLSRYFDYRKADSSYGRKGGFSHAVIHKNIQRKFGYKTFFTPEDHFEALARYLKEGIDRTIQGKRNRAQGKRNYHSYSEHGKTA